MKLRNKKTGEIATLTLSTNGEDFIIMGNDMLAHITKLSELKDYEDYEEPKGSALDLMILALINFIENEPDEDKVDLEDCKRILEKLKAWKRLKDNGFRFDSYHIPAGEVHFNMEIPKNSLDEIAKDMDVCFGGEE